MERNYYKKALMIAVPIMIQNGITNIVNMLDNIMVGSIGTNPMSGVAIVNQLLFIWNLCIFGGLSGIGIFTAQFYGKRDHEGIRYTLRLMFLLTMILFALGIFVFTVFNGQLISLYLHESGQNATETLHHAGQYMAFMLAGLLPFGLTQVYSTVLRSIGETKLPMRGSLIAVFLNLLGNYVLIFGHFSFPAMGVRGAALATVISRFAELFYVVFMTHRNTEAFPFIENAWSSFYVPGSLVKSCAVKGTPLLVNEALWSAGLACLSGIYSYRGLAVVAAMNICSTLSNVFSVAFIAMGSAIGIIIGQELGAGLNHDVKANANRLSVFAVVICLVTGGMMFILAPYFPEIYNTNNEVRQMAASFIRIMALMMPINSYANASYFIIRSGGKTWITFLSDSCFGWFISIPAAYVLVFFTALPIVLIYFFVQLLEILKCIVGFILVQKGIWINDITVNTNA
ncbi:MAG: MATE family efflux transporter [Faecalicoccus sp.]|nr:MATE family efflux transporter [Faecalicoccus sp.]